MLLRLRLRFGLGEHCCLSLSPVLQVPLGPHVGLRAGLCRHVPGFLQRCAEVLLPVPLLRRGLRARRDHIMRLSVCVRCGNI